MAARQLCLIGAAAMLNAIWKTGVYLFTTEVEIGFTGVAHRPAADPVIEIEQAGFISHFRAGLGGNQSARWRRRDGSLLITWALPQEATGADRDDTRLGAQRRRDCAIGERLR